MIDIEFLSGCDDNQINKGVAWLTIKEWGDGNKHKRKSIDYYCSQGLLNSVAAGNVNYCTKHNDIMPIAFANRIDIKHDYDVLESVTALIGNEDDYLYWATNTNPLRAICEVYILMSVNK